MNLNPRNPHAMQWTIGQGGTFQICGRTTERLPPGAYSCFVDYCGTVHFRPRDLQADDYIEFEDSLASRVLGFLHRRGYLLYGKQGCGKSSLIHQIVSRLVASGNVAFFCECPAAFVNCLLRFREVEPDRPLVCVFEDIDAIIKLYGDGDLLQWLDGNTQVNRAVNIASTNYPERLDRRILARPRRFDRILRIEAPDDRVRSAFFARKLSEQTREERARWVKLSEGLPFAALAELVISVQCMGNGLEESAALLRALDCHTPSSKEFLEDFGAEAEAQASE
jgi:SpoVK/Ycf46/Vps4 family AAA+-type ATPase